MSSRAVAWTYWYWVTAPALFARHSQRSARPASRALIDLGTQYLDALASARMSYVFIDGRDGIGMEPTPTRTDRS